MMQLADYKKKIKKSFTEISQETGIPKTTLHRIANDDSYCVRINVAYQLIKWSEGHITFADLLGGDC